MCLVKNRDKLLKYLIKNKIEAKIHYPKPIYLQEAVKFLSHKKGDFPVTDLHAKKIISFPCDQHLSNKQIKYIIKTVSNFYNNQDLLILNLMVVLVYLKS